MVYPAKASLLTGVYRAGSTGNTASSGKNGELLNAISLPVDVLASLTREVVLPVENCVLDTVDVIDIPAISEENTPLMMQAKCLWLLEHYRQHIQPDVLVICNATAHHQQTAKRPGSCKTGSKRQPFEESALPGLVWAITPS